MSLRTQLASAFREHIFEKLPVTEKWRVLVLDERATKVLTSVFTMKEITEMRILLIESLIRLRKPFNTEAIYIMSPTKQSLEHLVKDFSSTPTTYKKAHVYFLTSCPPDLLDWLKTCTFIRFAKTLDELYLDFVPVESCVYTLDFPETRNLIPIPPQLVPSDRMPIECLAERLVTVCSVLDEYPTICYRPSLWNAELAGLVQKRLDAIRENQPSFGQGTYKDRSVLLIVDRGADPVSALVHELTLQAAYLDLFDTENNTYMSEGNRQFHITGEDPLWTEFRHESIATIAKILPKRIEEFVQSKKGLMKLSSSKGKESDEQGYVNEGADVNQSIGMRELTRIVSQLPQFMNEKESYSAISSMTNKCMDMIHKTIYHVCELEQDMVMGETGNGEKIKDAMRLVTDGLQQNLAPDDKLRLLMLFVLVKDGISEGHLIKLLEAAQLPASHTAYFVSLCLLTNAQFVIPDSASPAKLPLERLGIFKYIPEMKKNKMAQQFLPRKNQRKDRNSLDRFTVSRWEPFLVDLMEDIIKGNPNSSQLSTLAPRGNTQSSSKLSLPDGAPKGTSARFQADARAAPISARRSPATTPHVDPKGAESYEHCGPRLIVFVVGGATWSEIRSVYEINKKCVETRVAESDRQTSSKGSVSPNPNTLEGGGGRGWSWQVVIGGSHIITPKLFLQDLKRISDPLFHMAETQQTRTARRSSLFPRN